MVEPFKVTCETCAVTKTFYAFKMAVLSAAQHAHPTTIAIDTFDQRREVLTSLFGPDGDG